MEKERMPHDTAYKQFFSNPSMVESLLKDFVPADFVADLDFSTLERVSGSYVTNDLRERHDDIVWRVGWKNGSWCYVVLLLEFQSTPDRYMALRILSYTALLLLDLIKTRRVHEGEGLPPVFPIVIYNGGRAWKAPQEVAELFAPMPESLKEYLPKHRHVLIDEGAMPEEELSKNKGFASKLIRLERAQNIEEIEPIINELIELFRGDEYAELHRAFCVWIERVALTRAGITTEVHEFQNLREVKAMLAERAAQWKDEYIRQGVILGRAEGEARGEARGRAEGIGFALQDVLEDRFGTLPQAVTSFIAGSSDANALRKLLRFAYKAETLQAVIEQMEKANPAPVQ